MGKSILLRIIHSHVTLCVTIVALLLVLVAQPAYTATLHCYLNAAAASPQVIPVSTAGGAVNEPDGFFLNTNRIIVWVQSQFEPSLYIQQSAATPISPVDMESLAKEYFVSSLSPGINSDMVISTMKEERRLNPLFNPYDLKDHDVIIVHFKVRFTTVKYNGADVDAGAVQSEIWRLAHEDTANLNTKGRFSYGGVALFPRTFIQPSGTFSLSEPAKAALAEVATQTGKMISSVWVQPTTKAR